MSFESGLPTTAEADEVHALNNLGWVYGSGEVIPF